MADTKSPALKTSSFGCCEFTILGPRRQQISQVAPVLNVTLSFEDALQLNLAIDECVRRLNRYNRRNKEGKRTALRLALHIDKSRITVHEGKL